MLVYEVPIDMLDDLNLGTKFRHDESLANTAEPNSERWPRRRTCSGGVGESMFRLN